MLARSQEDARLLELLVINLVGVGVCCFPLVGTGRVITSTIHRFTISLPCINLRPLDYT
jgi:hypothetical protein